MDLRKANLLNALVMITLGIWGTWTSTSWTAQIPIGFGLTLFLFQPFIGGKHKILHYLAFILTCGFMLALIMPFFRMIDEDHFLAAGRIAVMIGVGLLSTITFYKFYRSSQE